MPCLSESEFNLKYGKGRAIGAGSYGSVYESDDGRFAIKSTSSSQYSSFVKEAVLLSQLDHPNIIKIQDIAFGVDKFYFSQPLGTSVKKAFQDGHLTLRDIISDIFSAFAYLYVNGIAHCDLKDINMVFHEGRVKIIDFGIAKLAELFVDEDDNQDFMITGPAYTEPYRDPEYNFGSWNSIKTELYSILMTVYLMTNNYGLGENREYYLGKRQINKLPIDDDMKDLLFQCQDFLSDRVSILDLFYHPALDRTRMTEPEVMYQNHASAMGLNKNRRYRVVVEWVCEIALLVKAPVRIVLNAMALATALFSKNVDYISSKLSYASKYGENKNIQALACAVLYLSINMDSSISFDDLVVFSSKIYTKEQLIEATCLVFTVFKGQILMRTTYENIITEGDFKAAISAAIYENYDSRKCYKLNRPTIHDQKILNRQSPTYQLRKRLLERAEVSEKSCLTLPIEIKKKVINLESKLKNVGDFIKFVYYITRYREQLPYLSLSTSRLVLSKLKINNESANGSLFDRLLGFRDHELKLIPVNVFSLGKDKLRKILDDFKNGQLNIGEILTDEQEIYDLLKNEIRDVKIIKSIFEDSKINSYEIIKRLLSDPDLTSGDFNELLTIAVTEKRDEIVKLLFENSSDKNETFLRIIKLGDASIIKLFLFDSEIDLTDGRLLNAAVITSDEEIIEFLLHNAKIDSDILFNIMEEYDYTNDFSLTEVIRLLLTDPGILNNKIIIEKALESDNHTAVKSLLNQISEIDKNLGQRLKKLYLKKLSRK